VGSWSVDSAGTQKYSFLPKDNQCCSLLSLCVGVLTTRTLAHMLDSLVRVSRRDGSFHFAQVPNSIDYFHNITSNVRKAIQVFNHILPIISQKIKEMHVVGPSVSPMNTNTLGIHPKRTTSPGSFSTKYKLTWASNHSTGHQHIFIHSHFHKQLITSIQVTNMQ
jgi:hypothetical protein